MWWMLNWYLQEKLFKPSKTYLRYLSTIHASWKKIGWGFQWIEWKMVTVPKEVCSFSQKCLNPWKKKHTRTESTTCWGVNKGARNCCKPMYSYWYNDSSISRSNGIVALGHIFQPQNETDGDFCAVKCAMSNVDVWIRYVCKSKSKNYGCIYCTLRRRCLSLIECRENWEPTACKYCPFHLRI
jgi:hypothetical protein